MPKFCFGTPETAKTNYPISGRFDVEMKWNPDVSGRLNIAESETADKASTKSLLCPADTAAITLPTTSELFDHSKTSVESVVGWSM